MSSILSLPIPALVQKIRNRELTSEEIVATFYDRLEHVNPKINAVVQKLSREQALAEAKKADELVAKGAQISAMHGIPVTIKDCNYVKGMICTCGSKGYYGKPSDKDAVVVKRLRGAGAIVIGMTNVPELLSCVETSNNLYGQTNNPYDLARTSGGSSGGEGAIIAAGGSPFGIGGDAGGSIRIPAHFCGIAGIKPTQYSVPVTGSILGDTPGFFGMIATNGPMARYVEDVALGLSIIAGPDGKDPSIQPVPLKDYKNASLKNLRVAFHYKNGKTECCPETQQVLQQAAQALQSCVASVQEAQPKGLHQTYELVWETIFLGGDRGQGLKDWMNWLGITTPSPYLAQYVEEAEKVEFSVTELRNRMRAIDQFKIDILSFFDQYDIILCPVVATPAKLHGRWLAEIQDFNFTMTHNLSGCPAATVRCGTSKDGLPIGLQIIAKHWNDHLALAVAHELEKRLGGWQMANPVGLSAPHPDQGAGGPLEPH